MPGFVSGQYGDIFNSDKNLLMCSYTGIFKRNKKVLVEKPI